MRTIPTNLKSAYYKLKNCRLVIKGEVDDDSISFFETFLNHAMPVNEYENTVYYFLKEMYYADKTVFYNFLNNSSHSCLILYTDHISIAKHFNIINKVFIAWDRTEKKYKVARYSKNTEYK